MFYGEYKHGIDRKGRIILPARFRQIYKDNGIERFFITRGLDQCIFMFSEDEWRVQETKFKSMSFTKKESRNFNRLLFSGAIDVVPDKQGRFIIPPYLKSYAAIKKDVIIIGISNRIEVWDEGTWQKFYGDCASSFEQIAENIIET